MCPLMPQRLIHDADVVVSFEPDFKPAVNEPAGSVNPCGPVAERQRFVSADAYRKTEREVTFQLPQCPFCPYMHDQHNPATYDGSEIDCSARVA